MINLPEKNFNEVYEYAKEFWDSLVRETPMSEGSLLGLPHPYVCAGGFFKELYYWDSYFAIMGLSVQGGNGLIKDMVEDFFYLMETYGIIPNGNRTDYLSRSQPPYLSSMIKEVFKYTQDRKWLEKAFQVAKREYHEVWLTDGHLTSTNLSRYYDKNTTYDKRAVKTLKKGICYLAAAEAGWDYSPRFHKALQLNPIDLNSNLYRYERDFALFAQILGEEKEAETWENKATQRRKKVSQLMWDENEGLFYDYNYVKEKKTKYKTVATVHPLWSGLASQAQAQRLSKNISLFDQPGGLSVCDQAYGEKDVQWNYPNGFAMTEYYAVKGIKDYEYDELASELAYKWLKLNVDIFKETGKLWEKYNVVKRNLEAPARYPMQEGIAFNNGVFAALIGKVIIGLDYDIATRQIVLQPSIPEAWSGKDLSIAFSSYLVPWSIKVEVNNSLKSKGQFILKVDSKRDLGSTVIYLPLPKKSGGACLYDGNQRIGEKDFVKIVVSKGDKRRYFKVNLKSLTSKKLKVTSEGKKAQ